jgi:uncharacterized RDD family membrane protein YckC
MSELIEVKRYISQVMASIHAPVTERERIEADLHAHFQEALAAGESPQAVIARMGAPAEVAAEFMAQVPLRYAGFWWRLAAFGIDLAVIIASAGVFAVVAFGLMARLPQNIVGWEWIPAVAMFAVMVGFVLAALGIILLYFPILEGRFGQTVGKHLLGLRALKENGLPIGYKEAFLRRLSYYFEILPIDALFVPFTAKRQRAFDIVAHTIEVQESDNKRSRVILVAALIVALPLILLCSCFRPQANLMSLDSKSLGHTSYNFQSFSGVERAEVPGQGGRSIQLEYQATISSGSLSITVENPQREVVWQADLPAGAKSSHEVQMIAMNQGGNYVIVVEGKEAVGSLDVSWQNR